MPKRSWVEKKKTLLSAVVMAVEKTLSQVARDFQKNALCSDLETVPGVGRVVIAKLKENNINTTEQLVGQFFLHNRDEIYFIEYLEDLGILNRWARECAENFTKKFHAL